MSAYRFCRTDDVPLLVRAYNACRVPEADGEPPLDVAELKRAIRELGLWCSSCMVAFDGEEPVGVVFGCKRPPETFVHSIAVRPDQRRRGHGRHLLTSLSAKLAILGPPKLLAEIPVENAPARALFAACGYREERRYVDYTLEDPRRIASPAPAGLVTKVTVEELDAMGLLPAGGHAWERRRETLLARAEHLEARAIVSDERVEAFVCFEIDDAGTTVIPALTCCEGERGAKALAILVRDLAAESEGPLRLPRLATAEPRVDLEAMFGFERRGETVAVGSDAKGG